MEFTTCYCPYPQCTHYGKRGFNAHLVRCGADRGIPRLLCTKCQGTFSVRQGTAYFGIRADEPNYTIAMRALAEGNSLRLYFPLNFRGQIASAADSKPPVTR